MTLTLATIAAAAAARFSDRVALQDAHGVLTFAQLNAEVQRWARALVALSVTNGARVALWMPNGRDWVVVALATWRIGAVLVPLNDRYRQTDLAFVLAKSKASVLIFAAERVGLDFAAIVRAILPSIKAGAVSAAGDTGRLAHAVAFGAVDAPAIMAAAEALERGGAVDAAEVEAKTSRVKSDDHCLLLYTSGTTGAPKGVVHDGSCLASVANRVNRLGMTFADTILANLPYFHIYGLSECLLCGLITGARQVIHERFNADAALDAVERDRITVLHGFEAHFRALLAAQRARPRNLSSLRLATLPAGQATTQAVARDTHRELCPIVSGYGMTETWAFAATSFLDATEDQRVNASGYPSQGMHITIVDPSSEAECAVGVCGEIRVSGDHVMRGYDDDPMATRDAFDASGRLKTGDLGSRREDGHVRFEGRLKDILKVGGENVSPAEIEAELMRMPGVAEACVVGVPDARLTEIPAAFVRMHTAIQAPGIQMVDAHFRGRFATFKIPRYVFCVDEFPMTDSGKIQKPALKKLALQLMSARSGHQREAVNGNDD